MGSALALPPVFFIVDPAEAEFLIRDMLGPFHREKNRGPWLLKPLCVNSSCHFCLHSSAKANPMARPDVTAAKENSLAPGAGGKCFES